MADKFDFVLRDKIKEIGDRKWFLIPGDRKRRHIIYNLIAFCSLGDEDEALACINSLIKLSDWHSEIADDVDDDVHFLQFLQSLQFQLEKALSNWIIHHFRLLFAQLNLALVKNPGIAVPKPYNQELAH